MSLRANSRAHRFIVGLIFTGFALFAGIIGWALPTFRTWQAADWPSTTGAIEWSTVDKSRRSWTPVVKYRYQVAGREFTSDRLALWKYKGSHDWAKRTIEGYEIGNTVDVFYDPSNPAKAVLNREMHAEGTELLLFSLVFIAIGIGIVIWNRPKKVIKARGANN